MDQTQFQALWVEESPDGTISRRIIQRSTADLPPGEVLVRVHYSSLNYKDALSASGNHGVTRQYPHTPGIDLAGTVEESTHPDYHPGDQVIAAATGSQGVSIPGGYGQYVRVMGDRLTHLPSGMSLEDSMRYGTAGLTAALCIDKLRHAGVQPDHGEILVTGATGGVGTIAVAILGKLGYSVTAATGKLDQTEHLISLGAAHVVHRDQVDDHSDKPLLSSRWAGVVDTVGGNFLSTAIRSANPNGVVTCCGNAASADLSLTVYPFILRGVSLLGADSSRLPRETRDRLWNLLASDWKVERLADLTREVSLEGLEKEIQTILKGGQIGRVVVRLD